MSLFCKEKELVAGGRELGTRLIIKFTARTSHLINLKGLSMDTNDDRQCKLVAIYKSTCPVYIALEMLSITELNKLSIFGGSFEYTW